MNNELHIHNTEKIEPIQKMSYDGPPIHLNVQSLEKYGGPKNSLVYTVSDGVSILRLAGSDRML